MAIGLPCTNGTAPSHTSGAFSTQAMVLNAAMSRRGDATQASRIGEQVLHDGFEIDYAPGRKRGATRNSVTWQGEDGQPRSAVIGDHHPLVLQGHRFYTSPNKGFAPLACYVEM